MAKGKKSLEAFVAGLELDVRSVDIELIDFDEENPNEIPPELYEALKADIRDFGFWQPVLITPTGDRYRMIDGEHRTRIVSELGGTRIPAVIGDEWELSEARTRLLTMNRFKGDFVPIRLAHMVAGLADDKSEAELRQRLGMDDAELRGMLELTRFTDDPGERLTADIEQERKKAPIVLRFVVTGRDAEIIERVVAAAATDKMDRGRTLAAVCKEWEKAHPNQKPKEASTDE